jgi:hypothetical protein
MHEMLEHYLDRILSITDTVEKHLPTLPPDDTAIIDAGRLTMARLLTAYQLFIHRELFEPLLESGNRADVSCARELKAECIGLADSFRIHARKWALQKPLDRWDEYQPASLCMLKRVRQHAFRVRRGARRLEQGLGFSGAELEPDELVVHVPGFGARATIQTLN